MREQRKKEEFVFWEKALACIFITNSHCREIYPLYFLAVGGGWGNAIFFIISGYLLGNIKDNFSTWLYKRIKRMMPAVVICIVMDIIVFHNYTGLFECNLGEICIYYVNKYWFPFAMILFCLFYYFIFKEKNFKKIGAFTSLYFLGYILLYVFYVDKSIFSIELDGFSFFKVYFYFGIFLLGGIIKTAQIKIMPMLRSKDKRNSFFLFVGIVLGLGLWTIEYGAIYVLQRGYQLQFLIHLGVFIFSICIFLLGLLNKECFNKKNGYSSKIVKVLADSTFEIYLIQITFLPLILKLNGIIKILVFWSVALAGGILFHYILNWCSRTLNYITNRFGISRKN